MYAGTPGFAGTPIGLAEPILSDTIDTTVRLSSPLHNLDVSDNSQSVYSLMIEETDSLQTYSKLEPKSMPERSRAANKPADEV